MLKARMDYGAVSAKVLALYGRLLSEEDWRRVRECSSTSEVLTLLKAHSGWSAYVAELSPSADEKTVKRAILGKRHRDFEKLYRFCSLGDKELLRELLAAEEYSCLLAALRCLYSDESVALPETTDFIRTHSRVDIDALEQARSFAAIKAAAADSSFGAVLESLKMDSKSGLPDYSEAGVALERCYYSSVFADVTKKYAGSGKAELQRLLGTQADLLNLVGILRLHRYFRSSLPQAQELLVPVCGKLKPKLVAALVEAGSENEAVELLKQSPFSDYFKNYDSRELDRLYEQAMTSFCRKLVKLPEPSICVPVAYLTLSELECKRLVRIIETLSYGIVPEEQ